MIIANLQIRKNYSLTLGQLIIYLEKHTVKGWPHAYIKINTINKRVKCKNKI